MQIIDAKLMELKIDPANVRKTDVAPNESLLSSIRANGLLMPLTVRKDGKDILVTDGQKRLAAIHLLARDGEFDKTAPIKCVLREDDAKKAADISLTANFVREDMHDIDIYEAFATLKADGKSAEEIAASYGMPLPSVRQYLALGQLSPKVREAWKAGKFGDDDEDDQQTTAQLFTLLGDHAAQDAMLDRLAKQKKLQNQWQVKDAIVGNSNEAGLNVTFAGIDNYRAAGGTLVEDLFGDDHRVNHPEIAKKLAGARLQAECGQAVSDGWAWAEPKHALPNGAEYSWPRSYTDWQKVAKAERAKWGVALHIERDGSLGALVMQKPEQRKAAEKASKTKAEKKAGTAGEPKEVAISAALCGRLSKQVTKAAAAVLETDPQLALASIAAALTTYDGPVCIDRKGAHDDGTHDNEFAKQLALYRKKPPAELAKALAGLAASALDMGGHVVNNLPLYGDRDEDRALLDALDPKKLNAELRASFDAPDYFAGVTKDACVEAITLCDPKQPITGKEKKGDLAKLAAELVKKSNAGGKPGYLPPEMRTSKYDGPKAAKPKASATPAKKVAKKAAKKKAK